MVLEMGLEPTHPKAYASETYVSTIPPPELIFWIYSKCTCTPFERLTTSWMLVLGGMAPTSSLSLCVFAHLLFHHPSSERII